MRFPLFGLLGLLTGAACAASCSSFNDNTPATTDAGTPEAGIADVVEVDAAANDANVDAGSVDAGPCTDTCNSHHCDADGGCHPLVFVSNGKVMGNFGGLVGADALCNQEAAVENLKQDFVALLSDQQNNALTRITGNAAPSRPVWQSDGITQIAADYTHMFGTNLPLMNPITETAGGNSVPVGELVWTGTSGITGALAPDGLDCSEWSINDATQGVSGKVGVVPANWAYEKESGCNETQHLYCFEITH